MHTVTASNSTTWLVELLLSSTACTQHSHVTCCLLPVHDSVALVDVVLSLYMSGAP